MSDLWPFAACLLSCLSSPLFLSIQKLNWLIWLAGLCCSRHTVQIFCLGFRKTSRGASNTFLIPVDMVVSDDYMKLKDDSLELKKRNTDLLNHLTLTLATPSDQNFHLSTRKDRLLRKLLSTFIQQATFGLVQTILLHLHPQTSTNTQSKTWFYLHSHIQMHILWWDISDYT